MNDGKCDVVFGPDVHGMGRICHNLRFDCRFQIMVGLDMNLLRLVASPILVIPENLATYTNCCWANVVMQVTHCLGRRLSVRDTKELINSVRQAKSYTKNIIERMKGIITRLDLPVTFVEYYPEQSLGTLIGNINGPVVGCVLKKSHYRLWLPKGSTLEELFRSFDTIVDELEPSKPCNVRDMQVMQDAKMAHGLGDVISERKDEHDRSIIRILIQIRSDEAYALSL
jgi:hypothetical protein